MSDNILELPSTSRQGQGDPLSSIQCHNEESGKGRDVEMRRKFDSQVSHQGDPGRGKALVSEDEDDEELRNLDILSFSISDVEEDDFGLEEEDEEEKTPTQEESRIDLDLSKEAARHLSMGREEAGSVPEQEEAKNSDVKQAAAQPSALVKQVVSAVAVASNTSLLGQAAQKFSSQYHNPQRMRLTPAEYKQALQIKCKIEGTPDLLALSDFMYCQLAIVGGGNVDWAVNKAYQMQEYKQTYGIVDTVEDNLRFIPRFVQERHILSVDFNLDTGGYIMAWDGAKFNLGKALGTKQGFRDVMTNLYYVPQFMCPDFEAVRAGVTNLYECDGISRAAGGWSLKLARVTTSGSYCKYPIKVAHMRFFNPPTFFTLFLAMIKPSLPREMSSKFKVGGPSPGGRLDRIYNMPSAEAAGARLGAKLEEMIRRRYENDRRFSLADVQL